MTVDDVLNHTGKLSLLILINCLIIKYICFRQTATTVDTNRTLELFKFITVVRSKLELGRKLN